MSDLETTLLLVNALCARIEALEQQVAQMRDLLEADSRLDREET